MPPSQNIRGAVLFALLDLVASSGYFAILLLFIIPFDVDTPHSEQIAFLIVPILIGFASAGLLGFWRKNVTTLVRSLTVLFCLVMPVVAPYVVLSPFWLLSR
jgi:hypothetical protein